MRQSLHAIQVSCAVKFRVKSEKRYTCKINEHGLLTGCLLDSLLIRAFDNKAAPNPGSSTPDYAGLFSEL